MHDKDLSCEYVETLIAVIYNEATEFERRNFAAHALNCVSCREEIEQLTSIKSVVNSWRITEFDSLHSPLINFAPAAVNPVKAVNFFSWRKWLRGLLASPSGLTFNFQSSAAIAVLAIVLSAIAYSIYQRTENVDQAAINKAPNNQIQIQIQTPPLRQSETPLLPEQQSAEIAANTITPPESLSRKNNAPMKSVSDSKNISVKFGKQQTPRKIKPEPVTPKLKLARPNPANSDLGFDEAAEYDDKTLRLSDLIDEIGSTKE